MNSRLEVRTQLPEAAAVQSPERELTIDMCPDLWVRYEGTAAQLECEGLVPQGIEWPRAATDRRWQANGFDYWLRRARPEGHKGPKRTWLELDNWMLRIEVTGRCKGDWFTRRNIERKTEELKAAIHSSTLAGQHESHVRISRYCKARFDEQFQAFKSLLLPPRTKPGRKPAGVKS